MCACVCVEEEDGSRQLYSLWGVELVPFQGPWTGQLSPAPAQFHPSALRAVCVCVCVWRKLLTQKIVLKIWEEPLTELFHHNFLDLAAISTYVV